MNRTNRLNEIDNETEQRNKLGWSKDEFTKEMMLRECELQLDETLVHEPIESTPRTSIRVMQGQRNWLNLEAHRVNVEMDDFFGRLKAKQKALSAEAKITEQDNTNPFIVMDGHSDVVLPTHVAPDENFLRHGTATTTPPTYMPKSTNFKLALPPILRKPEQVKDLLECMSMPRV